MPLLPPRRTAKRPEKKEPSVKIEQPGALVTPLPPDEKLPDKRTYLPQLAFAYFQARTNQATQRDPIGWPDLPPFVRIAWRELVAFLDSALSDTHICALCGSEQLTEAYWCEICSVWRCDGHLSACPSEMPACGHPLVPMSAMLAIAKASQEVPADA